MASTPRMQELRSERSRRVVEAARSIAEEEGWPAVTIRRLAEAIGYSQPVLYSDFPGGRDEIVGAVIIDGSRRLTAAIAAAAERAPADGRLRSLVEAYLEFARRNPAVSEAMSSMSSTVAFASDDTPAELRAAFALLHGAVSGGDDRARSVRAEVLWGTLHGLSRLEASQRLDPALDVDRVDAVVALFGPG
ncbi:TetR/AcrR family transcriptional regulator [Agromyces larvae]|uniref:TetR/AcrR family transcriptional regulator n=1 Tax=Agromyces larvae TaxID=2929802 RepID=A0ABY4C0Z9_9MICO|nr:TetR/AcrR family transcriptional regulator [Agromyces larvae]UOE43786.1 TetR/AcrR family transcriptional regulator [Agromyces larvae]